MSTDEATVEEKGRATRASELYERLREQIVSCEIPPGQKLSMEMLRNLYGSGASPIREALNRLVSEGFVTQVDQKGFRAAPVSQAELADLTLARCWIGEKALAAAIANGGDAWEEAILLAFHRWERLLRTAKSGADLKAGAMQATHRAFHRALLSACGSDWMLNIWDMSFDYAQRYQVLSVRLGIGVERDPVQEHRALMEAVLERDVARALNLHERHLKLTAEIVGNLDFSAATTWK